VTKQYEITSDDIVVQHEMNARGATDEGVEVDTNTMPMYMVSRAIGIE